MVKKTFTYIKQRGGVDVRARLVINRLQVRVPDMRCWASTCVSCSKLHY